MPAFQCRDAVLCNHVSDILAAVAPEEGPGCQNRAWVDGRCRCCLRASRLRNNRSPVFQPAGEGISLESLGPRPSCCRCSPTPFNSCTRGDEVFVAACSIQASIHTSEFLP